MKFKFDKCQKCEKLLLKMLFELTFDFVFKSDKVET